jgi:ABC-type nitrate/sulfonate/bicarbonate transport system permease component
MASRESDVVERIGRIAGFDTVVDRPVIRVLIRYSPLWVLALLWQFVGMAGMLPYYVVAPDVIAGQLLEMARTGELVTNAVASLSLIYVGFVFAGLAGIGMGVLTGRSKVVGRVFDPLVSSIYPIPKIALFPLFLVWLGLGFESKVAVLAIAVFFPMYVNTNSGVRALDRNYLWSARNFGASRFRTLKDVILPAALPHIFSGLRVSVALSFIVVFSTELIAAREGLGHLVMAAQRGANYPLMYAALTSIVILGFLHTWALKRVESRALYWTETEEGI